MVSICVFVAIIKKILIGSKSIISAYALHIFKGSTPADPLNPFNSPPKALENYFSNFKNL